MEMGNGKWEMEMGNGKWYMHATPQTKPATQVGTHSWRGAVVSEQKPASPQLLICGKCVFELVFSCSGVFWMCVFFYFFFIF